MQNIFASILFKLILEFCTDPGAYLERYQTMGVFEEIVNGCSRYIFADQRSIVDICLVLNTALQPSFFIFLSSLFAYFYERT